MILFLYGKDTYRIYQKLKEIENRYLQIHKGGLNLEKIRKEDLDFQKFWDKFCQQSIFIKKKLFILYNIFSDPLFKRKFLEKIDFLKEHKDIVIIVQTDDFSLQDELFLVLLKNSKHQKFDLLEGEKLEKWIKKEFQKYNFCITDQGLRELITRVGNDLWKMSNEIKKLVLYKTSTKKEKSKYDKTLLEIDEKDVKYLVSLDNIETDVFKTIEALAQRRKGYALSLLQKHLQKGEHPLYLLSMIAFQFRNLILIKSYTQQGGGNTFFYPDFTKIAQQLGVHPYSLKKAFQYSSYFSLEELKKIYQKIFEVDLDIKTGKLLPEEALKWLVAQI